MGKEGEEGELPCSSSHRLLSGRGEILKPGPLCRLHARGMLPPCPAGLICAEKQVSGGLCGNMEVLVTGFPFCALLTQIQCLFITEGSGLVSH